MNRYAVLAAGFEHLSYPLGKNSASHNQRFSERNENFVLHRAQSEEHAKMIIAAGEGLSEHCALPVGYVGSEEGEVFVVSKFSRRQSPANALSAEERLEFCGSVMRRLASLHSQGFGCGGLSPDAMEFSGREAKLLDPSAVFALDESDSLFYEAVATLRSLAGAGLAKKRELPMLASTYLSASPCCRQGVAAHLSKQGVQHHMHSRELAAHAVRMMAYF